MTAATLSALVHPTVDLRLAIPAAAAWLCAVVLLPLPHVTPIVAIGCWAVALVVLLLALGLRRRELVVVAVAAAAIALVLSAAGVAHSARHPAVLTAAAMDGTRVTLTVTVTKMPVDGRFAATVTTVQAPGGASAASTGHVPVLVFDGLPGEGEGVGIGSTVRVAGTLVQTDAGDSTSYLVFATGDATLTAPPPAQLDWANALRATFAERAGELPGDGGMLLPGLAIGDTSAVNESLDSAMQTSSLTHLTAVSGANCAIIVGLITLAGAAIGLGRLWRIVGSLAVLVAFVVLVTPEPSVLRAGVMAGLVLAATATGRPAAGIPVLSVAVLALLVVDPWLARSFGFALSVLATGGLLVLAAPLTRLFARVLPLWLSAIVAVPVAAQLACQPVLILLDPSLPAFGIVANVLAAPAAPVATVVGLVACVLTPVLPGVATVLTQLAWLPAAWIGAVARFFSGLPFARIEWLPGVVGAVALTAITVFALVAVLGPAGRPGRRWSAFTALALLSIVVATSAGTHLASVLGRPAHWQLAACPIGQGDAMLVRSAGHTALIDTGPDPSLLSECLTTLAVDRVDLLILSHFDLDHVGGTQAVLGRATAALTGPPANAEDDRLLEALRASGVTVDQVSRGASGVLGDLRWSVLWPPARLGDIEPGNDASVVVRFDPVGDCAGGCLGSLFLGDLGEQAQERMTRLNRPIDPVDVVKVSHHGSADQSASLYQALRGTVGLVGVGADNDYGHPADPTLDLLRETHTDVARTDRDGLVLVAAGELPGEIVVWRENGDVGGDD